MVHYLLSLTLTSFLAGAAVDEGTQLSFKGSMVAEKGEAADSQKNFELTLVVTDIGKTGATVYWTIKEEGRGGWSWPTRFGRWQLDEAWRGDDENGPALLYDRKEGLSVVPLIAPMLSTTAVLDKGKEWKAGNFDHQVTDAKRIAGRDCWVIDVSSAYGQKRTLWRDKENPVIVALKEIVFIGQGERHYLDMQLTERKQLAGDELASLVKTFGDLERLRNTVGVEPRTKDVSWKDEQVALLKEKLPAIVELAGNGPLADVAREAHLDTTDQKNRNVTIAAMRKRIIGKDVAEFEMEALDGKVVAQTDLKGSVAVLHFWSYRDKPLEEPYGQIGYLDFLSRQVASKGVKIYGVTVDERLAETQTRRQAILSAKNLQKFMNLSYPILLDSGKVVRAFGDPRVAGGKLPLFVVVDKDGKVIHYHAGFYDVDRDRGLKELDEVIKTALGTAE